MRFFALDGAYHCRNARGDWHASSSSSGVREVVLTPRDRTAAGPTAPACGLTFMGVDYGPDELVVLD